ncbi:MAG: hypothetical protein ACO1NZ_07110 [Adhaeribacter sp.]
METTITTRLPLKFDDYGQAIVDFDFQALQEEYKNYYCIDPASQVMTVTDHFVLYTFRATLLPRSGTPVVRGGTRRYGRNAY